MGAERPEPVASLARGARVAGYVIEERIGLGGFGEVFRARHPVIDREVAIKILHARYSADPEAVSRFVSEARAVNQISHAGIVEVFDFDQLDDGRQLFIMELIRGRSLRDVLRERQRLPLGEALPILRGIAEAVDAAHAAGVAHRDLKPDNVFVLPDGRTKLIDFGLAKLTRETESLTVTGSVFGTPLYMSPEQCRGKALDARTDLYSFGALAYHVLAGSPPFSGEPLELALHHLNDRPDPPSKRCPGLSRTVDRVVLALLAKDPADRPSSLAAAVSALEGATTLRVRRSRQVKRLALAAAILGIAGAGAVAIVTRESRPVAATCAPAASRIDPIWNPQARAALVKRFAGRPDLAVTGRLHGDAFDAAFARWGTQWDGACAAPDRSGDPLLYGQRLACLENALLELRAAASRLAAVEPGDVLFDPDDPEPTTGRTLADCANPAVLRAQVAVPAPTVRDRVSRLRGEADRIATSAWVAAYQRDPARADRELVALDAIAREIEALDPPSATLALLTRSQILRHLAYDLSAERRLGARVALEDAIGRIEASRDDVARAHAYLEQATFELMQSSEPGAIDRAATALDRVAQAVDRAGRPQRASQQLARLRGVLAVERAELETAVRAFRDAQKLSDRPLVEFARAELIVALALAGRIDEALAEARVWYEAELAVYGPTPKSSELYLFMTLQLAGDLEGAIAVNRRYTAQQLPDTPPYVSVWGRMYRLELELQIGRTPGDAGDTIKRVTGTVPPKQNPDGIATARRAGLFAIVEYAAERPGLTGAAELADNAALLAYHRRDFAKLATLVSGTRCSPGSCLDWMRWSRWLAVLSDARAGRTAQVAERLAAIERDYQTPIAAAFTGIMLAELGRWSEARAKLEAARALPGWELQAELADLDTWLGLARLQAGDRTGARAILEESLKVLSIRHNGIAGFNYMRPVAQLALADLLWDADRPGDRPRARYLAARARDGFTRLGRFRDDDRERAVRWLAGH